MRILQVQSFFVPAFGYGGTPIVGHGLAEALVALGHDVTVVCTNLRDPHSTLEVRIDEPVDVDGARVFYQRVPFGRYWGFSPGLYRRAAVECETHDLVVTHFHYQFASVAAGAVARRAGKPYVVFTHGTLNRHGVAARSRALKMAYLRGIEASSFERALCMVYHSEQDLEQSHQFGTPEIVPIGLRDIDFRLPPARGAFRATRPQIGDRFVVAYMGRLGVGKGLELLLPAFARVLAESPDIHLLLIGPDDGYAEEVRRLIDALGIGHATTVTGLLTGEAKREALFDADAFVMPSQSEGLSLATLEALAMRVPAIVTDRMAISPDIAAIGEDLVVSYDETAIVRGLRKLRALEPAVRRNLGERGRTLVSTKFLWREIAGQLIETANRQMARKQGM